MGESGSHSPYVTHFVGPIPLFFLFFSSAADVNSVQSIGGRGRPPFSVCSTFCVSYPSFCSAAGVDNQSVDGSKKDSYSPYVACFVRPILFIFCQLV